MSSGDASSLCAATAIETFAEDRGGLLDRACGHRTASAPGRAGTEPGQRRVALNGRDLVDVDAQRVGGQLHHGGLDAVPGRPTGDVDVDRARGLDADGRALGRVVPEARRRRFDVVRQPDAEVPALGARCDLFGTERVVVEHLERVLERLERRDAVVGHPVRAGVRQVVSAEEVAATQLGGIDPDLARGEIEEHLAGQRLELPGTAVGGATNGIRVHGLRREAGFRYAVRAREQRADRGRAHHRPRRGVRAAVGHEVDADGLDHAVGIERDAHVGVLLARLARRDQVLAPILDPLHRCTELPAREHQAHLVTLHEDLLAEATAGVAHHDTDAVLGDAEQPRAEQTHLVR